MRTYDIGFLGGGQLARMSVQAAQRMGLKCLCLDPDPSAPAGQVTDLVTGAFNDMTAIVQILGQCERVTLENEFLPMVMLENAAKSAGRTPEVYLPSPTTLGLINNKLVQRQRYAQFGVPSPRALPIGESWSESVEIAEVVSALGYPLVIKSAFGGYDGKGTRTVRNEQDFEEHRALWEKARWFAEDFVPFKREVAVMVCRSQGQTVCFPTMETVQTNHVCDLVFPANVDASPIAVQAVKAVEGFGLFGVELFELEDGSFQVNEIAPRPHNTGHYTLDWGGISQFEAHVRLVLGLPIPDPKGQETCMANLLGIENAGDFREGLRAAIEDDPGVHVHWYGKAEARPGRKMGHINAVGQGARERALAARERFYAAWKAL